LVVDIDYQCEKEREGFGGRGEKIKKRKTVILEDT
jgi:hypothetical protein